jgi:hypothetical protein
MQLKQWILKELNGSAALEDPGPNQLVLVFGSVERLEAPDLVERLRKSFPGAMLAGCSTAGEITAEGLTDGSLAITSLRLERTPLRAAWSACSRMEDSHAAGAALAAQLNHPDLRYVLVLSDGVHVNGSALVEGIASGIAPSVLVTGGMAGDAGRFTRTLVLSGNGIGERAVVAVGFYGPHFRVGHGSMGGWEAFGPIRRVTRSRRNVVFELDGRPALSVYETYLGEDAKDLPASGLLFPLALVSEDRDETGLIRTLLGVERETGALIFAGDVPEGGLVRLMHANIDGLVNGAGSAADSSYTSLVGLQPQFALLISCVGRRLLMGRSTEQEIEAARERLGVEVPVCGFYSNGEISPFNPSARCELHNQTMTITTFAEIT